MSQKTYENEIGETMICRYQNILTINHSDIGIVYALPVGPDMYSYFTLDEVDIGIEHPETGEPVMYVTYAPAILSPEELFIIKAHIFEGESNV